MAAIRQVKRNLKNVLSHGGFEEIDSSIYAALTLADEPLTAREIAAETGYAYSTTINALNHLIKLGHIDKRRKGRKNIYFLTTDLTRIVKEEIRRFVSLLRQTARSIQRLDEARRQRVDDVLDMVNRSLRFLENVKEVET